MNIAYLADHPEQIPAVARNLFNEWGHLNPGSTLETRIAKLQLHRGHFAIPTTFIALDGDTLLGSASLVENDLSIRPHLSPFLASVFVLPEHRRKGVASALVRQVMATAKALDFSTLYLITHDQQSLYAGIGWLRVEEMEYRGESITLMQIAL